MSLDKVGRQELASGRRWGELAGVGRREEMGEAGRDAGKRGLPLLVASFFQVIFL